MKKILIWILNLFKKEIIVTKNTKSIIEEYTPEEYIEDYTRLLSSVEIREEHNHDIKLYVNKINKSMSRYKKVEEITGVPAEVIGVIHALEGACNFERVLHNGEKLTDVNLWGTRLYPKGRGKELNWTWEDSAIDAIGLMKKTMPRHWNDINTLYFLEKYNGLGYRKYHSSVKTPYLWSYTTHYTAGKYVADGKWSDGTISKQCGAVPLLIKLNYFSTNRPLPQILKPHYEIALSYMGEKEIIGKKHNKKIVSFFKRVVNQIFSDETPWAAAFVGNCLEEAGLVSTKKLNAKSYLNYGTKVDKPEKGDIVILWRSSPDSWKGYVGFYAGETKSYIKILGGNQNDQVCIANYPKYRLLGYRRP